MRWKWSLEHIERRIDRYYRLAAAARLPEVRQRYIALARRYRSYWIACRHPDLAPALAN